MDLSFRFLPLLAGLALALSATRAAAVAPILTSITTLENGIEDSAFTISYADLLAASNASDPDAGDVIQFRFKEHANPAGVLKKGNATVTANGTLQPGESWTWTPPEDAFGPEVSAFTVRAYDGTTESATSIMVKVELAAVNDLPSFTKGVNIQVDEDAPAFSQANWATGISSGPGENDPLLAFTVTTPQSSLFSAGPALSSTGTLTFTPAPHENGTATVSVFLNDGAGGNQQSATQTFTIEINPVNDPPVVAGLFDGTLASPLSDAATGGEDSPAAAQEIFSQITISDVDQGKPGNASQTVTVVIDSSSTEYGTFTLPGWSFNGSTTYTFSASTPALAQTALRTARFTPIPNAKPVGVYNFNASVRVRDAANANSNLLSGPVHVASINDPPTVLASLATSSIPEGAEATPFRLSVIDVDPGERFTASITETGTAKGTLTLPPSMTGTPAEVAAAVQNVRYLPFAQFSTEVATFQITVTDVHPDNTLGTPVPAPLLPLTITFVNATPEIAGITTELLRMTTDPAAPKVYPFATVTISDANPNQPLTVTLSLDDPSTGSFSGDFNALGQLTGTAAEVTTKLRGVFFVPAPGSIPLNDSRTRTITVTVSDGAASRVNSQTRIEVTAVDGAPAVLWDASPSNPGGVFPLPANPARIEVLPAARPFEKLSIVEAGEVVVTLSLDVAAKGTLTTAAGVPLVPVDGIYTFTGLATAVAAELQSLVFVPSPTYLFPPDLPGRTDFTITAGDSALNFTTELLPIVLLSDTRNHLVTNVLDDPAVLGSLRHALSVAGDNDVITFALQDYPATIRLNAARGPLVIQKNLKFRGPGADKLTLSGDSNSNGSTDAGDTQLFRIFAAVEIKGLRLTRGFAATGGAAYVGRAQPASAPGVLTLEDCIVSNCLASQWGGAIDVDDGALVVNRCLFEANSLNPSSALGGGAISLYTNQSCSILNTTFSGNSQPSAIGYGGGALYAENDTANRLFRVTVRHCTFAHNSDAANKGSAIHSNVSNTRVLLTNSLFGDVSARNLQVAGGGEIVSAGGNLSRDNTSTTLIQGGVPQQAVLLNQATDQRATDPKLAPLANVEGNTRGHRLLPDSPAVGTALEDIAAVDQRGVIRDESSDIGALDAGALGKLIVHEIFAPQTGTDPHFIEFYNPRDQAAISLSGYQVHIDGILRHSFSAGDVIDPGSGIILGDDLVLTPVAAPATVTVVEPNVAAVTPDLDLNPRGRIELRTPEGKVVEAVSYHSVFANVAVPGAALNLDGKSITLAPQFQGSAFAPHPGVKPPPGGVLMPGTGAVASPGADTGATPFGAENANPIAVIDRFEINEDDLARLNVLANDLDADGSDQRFIVDLNTTLSAGPPPLTNKSAIQTQAPYQADVSFEPTIRGTSITFDPRSAFNPLPAGARVTRTFAYSIVDVGGGAVGGYAASGADKTSVAALSHRMDAGESITITGAGIAAYNGTHVITAATADSFEIDVDFLGNPPAADRGRWQALLQRDPAYRSEALAEVTVLGRNDPPTPVNDLVATDERTVLRVFADPDFQTVGTPLDTDALYPQPRLTAGLGVLANDSDPDSSDNPFTQLRVVGVCQASPISGYSGRLIITSTGHGLASGASVTIRNSLAAYNGSHAVTVLDANRFSIGIPFAADPAVRGEFIARSGNIGTYASGGTELVKVTAPGHGLSSGQRVEITGSGVAAYNGIKIITRLDDDNFTFAQAFSTNPAAKGSWQLPLPITAFQSSLVSVTAAAHGLESGNTVLISGYGGHRSYNGYHAVTVTGPDTFTLPVPYVDNAPAKGLWTILDDSNRLATASRRDAEVRLEIRADRKKTNIVYNPRPSAELDALALGVKVTDTFYYAVEDSSGAVSLAELAVEVTGVNDAPVLGNDPSSLAGLDLPDGTTLPAYLGGSQVLYLLPSANRPGGTDAVIIPPGGDSDSVTRVADLDRTDEDSTLGFSSAYLLSNDSDIDVGDILSIEVGPGQSLSREGAQISLSADGSLLTYDPRSAPKLQALAFKERVIDTFTITVFDGNARVESLVAVLVDGVNDQPVAANVPLTTPEKSLLAVTPPGLLLSGIELDRNTTLPDNRLFLLPVAAAPTTITGAKVDVTLARREGLIQGFTAAAAPAATTVVSPAHGLQTGEDVIVLGSGRLTGRHTVTLLTADTFSIPVAFDAGFTALAGGTWQVLASTFSYDPRGSVFTDLPGDHLFTLQGLAEGQTYVDSFTYTMLDGSFLFANDDIFRVEADRGLIELRVLDNDSNLEGVATTRRIVETGPPSNGGTVAINDGLKADLASEYGSQSLIYTPETGFVGDEIFTYTIEDDLGNRDSAVVTVRVTIDRLNGNLRAQADTFTVAAGQAPLLDVLANDSIIPATGDPLLLVPRTLTPDQGGSAVIEAGRIRYTPDPAATVFPYTETFAYTLSGGGTASAEAMVTVLVVDRRETLNVRADSFAVPASSAEVTLNVLENDNILPGSGEDLEILEMASSKTPHGTVTILNGVALSYTPDPGFLGTDSFSYTATDGLGGTGTAQVTVQIGYLTTNNDIFSVRYDSDTETTDDGVTALDVLANDGILQAGGGGVTITGVTPLTSPLGTIAIAADTLSLDFDPAEAATGQQDFVYTITDGSGRSANGTVTVVVVAGGIRASSDFFTVQTDSTENALPVLANDIRISELPGELAIASIGSGVDGPDQGGTVEISSDFKSFSYTPAAGFRGVESFTYTVTDGLNFDTARVSVRSTVGEMVAGEDAFLVFRGSTAAQNRLAVLLNDRIIPDAGQLLFITAIGTDPGNPANPVNRGVLEIIDDGGALSYTPSPENTVYPYVETFTYEISSGGTTRSEALVRIEVLDRVGVRNLETNDDSFAVRSDSNGTLLPVLANDSVLPASAAGWILDVVTAPTSNVCSPFLLADFADPQAFAATLAAQATPLAQFLWDRFEPASKTLFGNPAAAETDLRVALVTEFNDLVRSGSSIYDATRFAGIALREQTQALLDQGASGEQLIVLNRLLVEDGYPLAILREAGAGTVQIVGTSLIYTPQPGFVGSVRFTYFVSDGLGGTGSGEVSVRVGDISVSADSFTLLAGTGAVELDVTANDGVLRNAFPATPLPAQADFTLTPVRAITLDPPAAGSAVVAGEVVSFTPDPAFTGGKAVLTYWVADDAGCLFPGTAHLDIRAPGNDRDSAVASITVTGVNDPPQLLVGPTATDDKTPTQPFADATVIEYDDQRAQPVTLRITYPVGQGVLGGGFTLVSPGVLEFTGTAAEVTAALRALVFTPFENRITVGQTEDTRFTVSLDDGFVTTPVIVDTAVTTVTPVNEIPVITGTVGGQKLYQRSTLRPFVGVNITDIDDLGLQPLEITVQLDGAIKGFFSNLGGFVLQSEGSGTYRFTSSPAAVSAALRGLVFVPTPGTRVTPTSPEIVGLSISINDAFAAPVVDTVTTVEVLHAEVDRLLALDALGADASQPAAGFGTSSAISRDTLVIGAPLRDIPAVDGGRVYVHERASGFGAPWGRVAAFSGSDTIAGDLFGQSVAIDGDFMAVGAPGADLPGTTNVGAVYVFQRDPGNRNAWLQVAKILPPAVNSNGNDAFGTAVALQGNTLLIGAPNANLPGAPRSGRVFVFKLGGGGPGNWTASQVLVALDNRTTGLFGDSEFYGAAVALDGDTAIIGAHGANRSGSTANWNFGAAYIHTRPGNAGSFTEIKRLDEFGDSEVKAYSGFGFSVDISVNTVVVGVHATTAPFGTVKPGRARIYDRNAGGANQWGLVHEAVSSDGLVSTQFGRSVAIADNLLLVGSPGGSEGSTDVRGFVEVVRRTPGAVPAWLTIDRVTQSSPAIVDRYGNSVAIDGFTGVAGASNDGANALNAPTAGSARVFQFLYDLGPRLAIPVPDQLAVQDAAFSYTLDADTFGDPVYPGQLVFSVELLDGNPLPPAGWLTFNPTTRAFGGTPTAAERRDYSLRLVATNPLGSRVSSNVFEIALESTGPATLEEAYEEWAAGKFAPGDLANPALEATVWGQDADFDKDGVVNLLEMLFGLDPANPDLAALGFTRLSATQSTLTFQRSADFPADEVRVEWSTTNTGWTTAGVAMVAQPEFNGSVQTTATITSPVPQTRIFVRVAAGN